MKAVNLLPSDQRGPAKAPGAVKTAAPGKGGGSSFGAYAVLGALAFAVVAMAAYVLTTNTIKDREAELARVNAETAAVQAKAAALQPFAEFRALAANRVETVTSLATSRFDWERSLRDLSRALPRDVHLKSFKGSTGSAAGGGSALRTAVQAPAIELSGCTSSQSGVARLMARLRAVRGVTRVSLVKSDKGATGVSVASAAGGTGASLCRKSDSPSFDLVVFFERAAVPPSALPNNAPQAGAAGAAPPGGSAAPSTGAAPNASSGATAPNTAPPATSGGTTQTAPGTTPSTQGVSAP